MTTKTKKKSAAPRRGKASEVRDALPAPLTMALAILAEPLRRLRDRERAELVEALGHFAAAADEDDRREAARTIVEICNPVLWAIDPAPLQIMTLDESLAALGPGRPGEAELRAWTRWTAARIRLLRKRAGLTQAELASRADLTQSHVSSLEAGQYAPNGLTREKLAKALGVNPKDFDPPDGATAGPRKK